MSNLQEPFSVVPTWTDSEPTWRIKNINVMHRYRMGVGNDAGHHFLYGYGKGAGWSGAETVFRDKEEGQLVRSAEERGDGYHYFGQAPY